MLREARDAPWEASQCFAHGGAIAALMLAASECVVARSFRQIRTQNCAILRNSCKHGFRRANISAESESPVIPFCSTQVADILLTLSPSEMVVCARGCSRTV